MRVSPSLLYPKKQPNPNAINLASVLKIENGTFYKHHPTTKEDNPALFPGLNFTIKNKESAEYWAVVGPSNAGKSTFLEILAGRYLCVPPLARSYPDLSTPTVPRKTFRQTPSTPIQYVGFNPKGSSLAGGDTKGAYMSARYESRREETDFSVWDYLIGNTNLNPDEKELKAIEKLRSQKFLLRIVELLQLSDLLNLPVSNLSNGQTRRAKLAKALTLNPKLLLLDEPFLGLDPMTKETLSPILWSLSRRAGPSLVISLPDNDKVPTWITHLLYIGEDHKIHGQGPKYAVADVLKAQRRHVDVRQYGSHYRAIEAQKFGEAVTEPQQEGIDPGEEKSRHHVTTKSRWYHTTDLLEELNTTDTEHKEPVVEIEGARVRYGGSRGRYVIGSGQQIVDGERKNGLWWNINRGDRWGLFGPNGSGKTTLLSLISSDHPQAYSTPMKIFGRSRLPTATQPGISIFDLQSRIGQSSPEIHNFFPRSLTIRQTIENSWAETFLTRPVLSHENDNVVDASLRWFRRELDPNFSGQDPVEILAPKACTSKDNGPMKATSQTQQLIDTYLNTNIDWADSAVFREASFSAQRVALFIRAIIKKPDLLILDEAFSGLDEYTRIKCMMFLAYGETVWFRPPVEGMLQTDIGNRSRQRTILDRYAKASITGLEKRQALINVSHRRDEVPPIIQKWLCLPEVNTQRSPRFGVMPFEQRGAWAKADWWNEIWEV